MLASLYLNDDWDWSGAERHFRRAFELHASPDVLVDYSQYHITIGRFAEAIVLRTRITEMDPLSVTEKWRLGSAYLYARQYNKAIASLQSAIALDGRPGPARLHLARAYAEAGMFSEATAEARLELAGPPRPIALGSSGYVLARAGHQEEAVAVLQRMMRTDADKIRALSFARLCVGLGRHDEAFSWLEKAIQDHNNELIFLRVDPTWDSIRADLRFTDLVRRVGIPDLPRAAP